MHQIAETYVRLALAVGQHDSNYVDAYYGPSDWQAEAQAQPLPLPTILERCQSLLELINEAQTPSSDPIDHLRKQSLTKQIAAMTSRVEHLSGAHKTFDQESAELYDAVDTGHGDEFYAEVLSNLEPVLGGSGDLARRYESFRSQFYVPKEKLETVFQTAIDAAREKTKQHVEMPLDENFRIEYVSEQVWGAYNWYKGQAHSLIQVNTDFPLSIERALHLACHEGYPGHHVYNALLERDLARGRNWIEFTIYPLFSPQSLIAEGTAEYGVDLSFPKQERLDFEKQILFPLAGLDSSRVEEYFYVLELIDKLGYSSNDAARRYLDGERSRSETIDWLVTYSLSTPKRAEQRVRFIEQNRSYVITYNVGRDMVQSYIEKRGSTLDERWKVFVDLLSTPRVASSLV